MGGEIKKTALVEIKGDTTNLRNAIDAVAFKEKDVAAARAKYAKEQEDAQGRAIKDWNSLGDSIGKYGAAAGSAISALKVVWDGFTANVEHNRQVLAAGATDIERLRVASHGLVSETKLLSDAAAFQNGIFKLTEAQMETVERAMVGLSREGKDSREVHEKLLQAVTALKTEGLQDLGIHIDKAGLSMDKASDRGKIFNEVMDAMTSKSKAVKDGQSTMDEQIEASSVKIGDSMDKLKRAMSSLVQAVAPVIDALASVAAWIAKIAETSAAKEVGGWAAIQLLSNISPIAAGYAAYKKIQSYTGSGSDTTVTPAQAQTQQQMNAAAIASQDVGGGMPGPWGGSRGGIFGKIGRGLGIDTAIDHLGYKGDKALEALKYFDEHRNDEMTEEQRHAWIAAYLRVGPRGPQDYSPRYDDVWERSPDGEGFRLNRYREGSTAAGASFGPLDDEGALGYRARVAGDDVLRTSSIAWSDFRRGEKTKYEQSLTDSWNFRSRNLGATGNQPTVLQRMFGKKEEFDAYKELFQGLTGSIGSAYDALVDGTKSGAEALKSFVHDALKALGHRMLIRALEETAEGFAALANPNPLWGAKSAASHFQAAGLFAAGAVAAGVAASQVGSHSSGGAGSAAPSSSSSNTSVGGTPGRDVIVVMTDPFAEDNARSRQNKAKSIINKAFGTGGGKDS